MAITVVQTADPTGNPPWNFGSNVTAGNTVFAMMYYYNTGGSPGTISSVQLGGSTVTGTIAFFNSGTTGAINSASDAGNVASIGFWMLPNCPGGQKALDATITASVLGVVMYEVSGMGATPALDKSNSGSSIASTALSSGASGNITAAPEFIMAGGMEFGGAGSTNPAGGWTYVNPSGDIWGGYQIAAASGGSYTWTQTSGGLPWAAGIITVPGLAAAAAARVPGQLVRAQIPQNRSGLFYVG
jgi:hypothetical protein